MADPKNPFAKLAALREALPPGETKAVEPVAAPERVDPIAAQLARKTVVRKERKGRGGKTVTVVQFPDGATGDVLDALAKELRKALGTASHVEDGAVVVAGDIGDRVADWLTTRGATRIVRG